jgi:DNA-binding response OmpR family regulator
MSNVRKILIVDDDDDLRESLRSQLALHDEFDVTVANTASSGVEIAKAEHHDLVLFDVGLPDMDGREAVKILRKSGFKSPVIMLTGNDSDADQILGLDAGANDYVTKPFKFAVLLARIRAQLRPHEQSEDAIFTIGHYTFKPASKLLVDEKGAKIRLTEKETSILKFLCTKSGATTPASPPTRLKPTSIACARRSKKTPQTQNSSSPKPAATNSSPRVLPKKCDTVFRVSCRRRATKMPKASDKQEARQIKNLGSNSDST